MGRLGHIKDIDGVVERQGGTVVEKIRIKTLCNPLGPTVCFVITPPREQGEEVTNERGPDIFFVPGIDYRLREVDEFYLSDETGLCFPVPKKTDAQVEYSDTRLFVARLMPFYGSGLEKEKA